MDAGKSPGDFSVEEFIPVMTQERNSVPRECRLFVEEYNKYRANRGNIELLISSIGYLEEATRIVMLRIPEFPSNLCHFKTLLNILLIIAIESKKYYVEANRSSHDGKSFEILSKYESEAEYKFADAIRRVYTSVGEFDFPGTFSTEKAQAYSEIVRILVWLSSKRMAMMFNISKLVDLPPIDIKKLLEWKDKLSFGDCAFPESSLLLALLVSAMETPDENFKGSFELTPNEQVVLSKLNLSVANTLNRQTIFAVLSLLYVPKNFLPKWDDEWHRKYSGIFGTVAEYSMTDSYRTYNAIVKIVDCVKKCDIAGVEKILDDNRCSMCKFRGYMKFAIFVKLKVRIQLFKRLVRLMYRLEKEKKITIIKLSEKAYIPLSLYALVLSHSMNYKNTKESSEAAKYIVIGAMRYKLMDWELTLDGRNIVIPISELKKIIDFHPGKR